MLFWQNFIWVKVLSNIFVTNFKIVSPNFVEIKGNSILPEFHRKYRTSVLPFLSIFLNAEQFLYQGEFMWLTCTSADRIRRKNSKSWSCVNLSVFQMFSCSFRFIKLYICSKRFHKLIICVESVLKSLFFSSFRKKL